MPQVKVRGAELEYREPGEGDSLFLVHGSQSDYRTWTGQMERFGASYRTIAYSRRYHWPNAPIPPRADYSMMEHVEDLAAVIRSLGEGPAHIVGHSYGAYLTLLLAIRRPELIRRMVLGKETFENLSAERLQQARDNLIDAEFLGSGFAAIPDAEVSGVGHRTLLLGSTRSPPVFGVLLDRLQELLPRAERQEIPDASHIMHEDNPDAFFQAVTAFLHSPETA